MARFTYGLSVLALLTVAAGCGTEDVPPGDPCAAITCGAHAHCSQGACACDEGFQGSPAEGCSVIPGCESLSCGSHGSCSPVGGAPACVCQQGWAGAECASCATDYALEGGSCVRSKSVACRDEAPANATSTSAQVEVTYTSAAGWSEPAACAWSCDTDFALEGGACIDSKQVPCADVAPANATSTVQDVVVTYSTDTGWTAPASCAWTCNADFAAEGGACVNSKTAPCNDAAPANATSTVANVTVTYTSAGGWTTPADCAWTCNLDYALEGGACIGSKLAPCADAAPQNATSLPAEVTIFYTTSQGWSAPAACAWVCDADFAAELGACIDTKDVPCHDAAPVNASSVLQAVTVTYTSAGGWTMPADCDWACDAGFDFDAGTCINSKTVPCTDAAPPNATSTVENVTITYTALDGWSEPLACPWTCNADFAAEGGACIDSKTVPCRDAPPPNAVSLPGEVTITYTSAGGWSVPEACAWDCDTDFALDAGACLNSRTALCSDQAPANATSVVAEVTVTYTSAGGWSEPAACAWACDADYAREADACVNSKLVACRDAAPPNATSVAGEVAVTYTSAGGWTTPEDCAWTCDTDFDLSLDATACIHEQLVPCVDVAPVNATSTVRDVAITYTTAAGWTDPAECAWSCNVDFALEGGACIDTKVVPCTDAAPAHATSVVGDVTITYTTAGGWSTPAACAWDCDVDYERTETACINTRTVQCADAAPLNATSVVAQVTITYTTAGGWTEPAECAWNCNVDFFREALECINTRVVPCLDQPPASASSILEDVTLTYTTADGWSPTPKCNFVCNDGYHRGDGVCLSDASVDWCNVQWPPALIVAMGERQTVYGQVYSVDGTGAGGAYPNIIGMWCRSSTPIALPVDVSQLDCEEASYNVDVGNNDEYKVDVVFEEPGRFEYIFAFSGDGGMTWASCDTAGLVTDTLKPGVATVSLAVMNGGFESWTDDGKPEFWTADPGVGVARETVVAHGGSSAVRLTRNSTTNSNTDFVSARVPVDGGGSYTISLWFFDNSADARAGYAYQWFDGGGVATGAAVWSTAYTANSTAWQELRSTATAPANAAYVLVSTRTYTESSSSAPVGGSVLLDDVTVTKN